MRRNPNGRKRSDFNSDKTKLLRPILFKKFENEPGVSFCYSDDPLKENDDSTILPISQNSLFINDEQIGFKIRMNYRENANKYRNF